jgi:hypothetical protein
MKRVMVRYKVKPERVAEHEGLIAGVFSELATTSPPGLRYSVYRQRDGVSFVHVAFVEAPKNPLDEVAAFKAFTANVRDRCDEPPATLEYDEVAAYRF